MRQALLVESKLGRLRNSIANIGPKLFCVEESCRNRISVKDASFKRVDSLYKVRILLQGVVHGKPYAKGRKLAGKVDENGNGLIIGVPIDEDSLNPSVLYKC